MNKVRLRTGLAAAGVLALIAAGCGDDSDDDAATDDADEVTDETDDVTDDADDMDDDADGDGETIVVTGVDFAFQDLPDTVSVGTQISFVNDSEGELHELVALRIADDEDRSLQEIMDEALELPEDEGEEVFDAALAPGPPVMVLVAPPGEEAEAVPEFGDTFTEPGRYAIVCFIPTGVDPEEYFAAAEEAGEGPPEVEGGPPHIVHGMFAELTVE